MNPRSYFGVTDPIPFAGPAATDPFAYRHYDRDEIVLGKRMEDLLRPAVCYWHTLGFDGLDPFGGRDDFSALARQHASPTIASRLTRCSSLLDHPRCAVPDLSRPRYRA